MSYDIYVETCSCGECQDWVANFTFNFRGGLDAIFSKVVGEKVYWCDCLDEKTCEDVVGLLEKAHLEAKNNYDEYKKYDAPNGWGKIVDCVGFLQDIRNRARKEVNEGKGARKIFISK
jgi:hypothetical protein